MKAMKPITMFAAAALAAALMLTETTSSVAAEPKKEELSESYREIPPTGVTLCLSNKIKTPPFSCRRF